MGLKFSEKHIKKEVGTYRKKFGKSDCSNRKAKEPILKGIDISAHTSITLRLQREINEIILYFFKVGKSKQEIIKILILKFNIDRCPFHKEIKNELEKNIEG